MRHDRAFAPSSDVSLPSRGTKCPSSSNIVPPEMRAREMRWGAGCARSLVCKKKSTRVSHHGHTGTPGISRANGFTAYSRLSPAIGLFVTVPGAMRKHRHQVECQRRGIRTTRLRRPFSRRPSSGTTTSTASRPTFVTMANAPLPGGTGKLVRVICPTC